MLTTQLYDQQLTVRQKHDEHGDLSRLLAAAVVSRQFCHLLLTDPARAINQGYAGESFSLSSEDYNLVISAQASNLPELAQQLSRHVPATKNPWKPALSEIYQMRV